MELKEFNETFANRLRDKTYLSVYLSACLAEGLPAFYVGLRRAVQAHEGGFTWLARETGMVRAGLYQALSANGNPSFKTIYNVLVALGIDPGILTGKAAGLAPSTDTEKAAVA